MSTLRRLTAEDLFCFRLPGDAQISPDGSRIAYVESAARQESNDYQSRIMLLIPGQKPRPLTSGEKDSNPRWSPDGHFLSFTRGGQVWLLPAGGGEAWQLTKQKGCSGPAVWSPDSRKIALTVTLGPDGLDPEKADGKNEYFKKFTAGVKVITDLHYKEDGTGFAGDKKQQILIVDVETGDGRQLTGGPFCHMSPAWSPDGQWIALSANREEDGEDRRRQFIWVVPSQPSAYPAPAEAFRQVSTEGVQAYSPCWSPDGSRIAFLGESARLNAPPDLHLYVVEAAGGEARCLTGGHDRPVGNSCTTDVVPSGSFTPTWAPDSTALFALISDGGSVYLARVAAGRREGGPTGDSYAREAAHPDAAASTRPPGSSVVTYLTAGEQVLFGGSATADCSRFALTVGRVNHPAEVFLLTGNELRQLTHANGKLLEEVAIAPVRPFTFRAGPDAPVVDGWIVEPVDRKQDERYPAILEIHGGPAMMYGATYHLEFQYLASQGFAIIYTNPRGSVGYGQEFSGALANARWGTVDYDDLMAGVDAALQQFAWIDRDRLGVAGGSYGGYMTNWIVGHTDRFKAAATMRSISNWMTMWATSDISYEMIDDWGAPWEDETPWRRISPLTYVTRIHTPILIEHQEEDHRCPVEQAEQLYVALRKMRRPVKFVRYPGESHGMSRNGRPWHRVHRLLTLTDWFRHYLGAEA